MRVMTDLRRHQLARLSERGWRAILAHPWDPEARDGLSCWAARRLPLVVTRQDADAAARGCIALGLPAPACWGRRRLVLQVPRTAVLAFGDFPCLAEVQELLPPAARRPVRDLLKGLDACRATARVFGSYGWQAISGLDHVRPDSDLDLWIGVRDALHADAAARVLHSFGAELPRLDGELLFGNGAGVAWREWSAWRAGRVRSLMVKQLTGVTLQRDAAWCESARLVESVG